jgi:hypothetical protein
MCLPEDTNCHAVTLNPSDFASYDNDGAPSAALSEAPEVLLWFQHLLCGAGNTAT